MRIAIVLSPYLSTYITKVRATIFRCRDSPPIGDIRPESPGYVQSRTRNCLVDYTSSSPLEELQEAWEISIPSGELLDAGQDPNVQPSAHLQEIDSLLANGREVDATSSLGEAIDQGSAAVSIFDTESPWDAIGNILGLSRTGADETAFHQHIAMKR